MRSHQFDLNPTLFPLEIVVQRLRSYCRNRFGHKALPKKGNQARARRARLLTCKPWKR
jgi:hypothetical protein